MGNKWRAMSHPSPFTILSSTIKRWLERWRGMWCRRVCQKSPEMKGTWRSVHSFPLVTKPGLPLWGGLRFQPPPWAACCKQQEQSIYFPVGVCCGRDGFNILRLLALVFCLETPACLELFVASLLRNNAELKLTTGKHPNLCVMVVIN